MAPLAPVRCRRSPAALPTAAAAAAVWVVLAAQGPTWLSGPPSPRGIRRARSPANLYARKRDTGEFDFGEFDVPTMADPATSGVSVMDLDAEEVDVFELAPPEAEVFLQRATGESRCLKCGFTYNQMWGQGDYGPGTTFEDLPASWCCPECGTSKTNFETLMEDVAGFAENQKYGLGFNSWTANEKGVIIYGGLLGAFMLFMYGYTLE